MRNSEPRYPSREVGDIIGQALAEQRKKQRRQRHPAEVTSDRLGDAVTKWGDQFTPAELDMVGTIRHRLERIAEQASSDTRPR